MINKENHYNPLVSVIIPTYNSEKFIYACIDSVIKQSYKNLEIIVVDDCSSDSTPNIVKSIIEKDRRIQFFRIEKSGVSSARNFGLSKVSGDYISFIDSDDMLTDESIAYMVEKIKDADIFMGSACNIYEDHQNILKTVSGTEKELYYPQPLKERIKDNPMLYGVVRKLFKSSSVKGIEFPIGKSVNEDSLFIYKCLLTTNKVIISTGVVYAIRNNSNSVTRQGFSDVFFQIPEIAQIEYELVVSKEPGYVDFAKNIFAKSYMSFIDNLIRAPKFKYHNIAREYVKKLRKIKKTFIPKNKADSIKFYLMIYIFELYYFFKKIKLMIGR